MAKIETYSFIPVGDAHTPAMVRIDHLLVHEPARKQNPLVVRTRIEAGRRREVELTGTGHIHVFSGLHRQKD